MNMSTKWMSALVLTVVLSVVGGAASAQAASSEGLDGEVLIGANMANPITGYETFEELQSAAPDIKLLAPPKDAVDIAYTTISGTPLIAQIEFEWDGDLYTMRAVHAKDDDQHEHIDGVYIDFDNDDAGDQLEDAGLPRAIDDFVYEFPGAVGHQRILGQKQNIFLASGLKANQDILANLNT